MKKNRLMIMALLVLLLSSLIPVIGAVKAVAETAAEIPLLNLKINDKKQRLGSKLEAQEEFEVSFDVSAPLVLKIAKNTAFQIAPIVIETATNDQPQVKTEIYQDDRDYLIPVVKDQRVFFQYQQKSAEATSLLIKGHQYLADDPTSYQENAAFEKLLFQTASITTEQSTTVATTEELKDSTEEALSTDVSAQESTSETITGTEATTAESAEESTSSSAAISEDQIQESQEWSQATEALTPRSANAELPTAPSAQAAPEEVSGELTFAKEEILPNGENHLTYQASSAGAGIQMVMTLIQLPTESVDATGQIKQIYYQWATGDGENPERKVYYSMEEFTKGPAYFYNKAVSSESIPADWYPWEINQPVGINPRTMIILSLGSPLTANEPAIDFTMTMDHGVSGYHFQSRGAILEWNDSDPSAPILHEIPTASFVIAGFSIAGQVMTDTTDSPTMSGVPAVDRQVSLEMTTDGQNWSPVLTHEAQPQPKTTQTDATGNYRFTGLPPGTYRVTVANDEGLLAAKGISTVDRSNLENKAQAIVGQQLVSQPIEFPVTDLAEANIGTPVLNYSNMNLKFYRENGSISIDLVDSDTGGRLASGEFQLLDSNGDLVTTDINGQAYPVWLTDGSQTLVISKLPLGEYRLVESKSPQGYELVKDEFTLTLTSQQKDVSLKVANQLQAELPFTGNNGIKPEQLLLLALLSLVLSLSSVMLKKFKFDWGKWLLLLLAIGGSMAYAVKPVAAAEVYGENTESQNELLETTELRLSIHKYGYTGEYRSKVKAGMSDEEIQAVLGSDPQLQPLAGIRYRITEIQRNPDGAPYDAKNPATYQIDPSGFSRTIETNHEGIATVSSLDGLLAGDYLITELPDPRVEIPMAAKITALPRTDESGAQLIYDVHMYPKEPVTEQPTPPSSEPSTTPSTSTTPSNSDRPPITTQPIDPPLVKVVPDTGTIGQLINKVAGMIPQTNDIQRAGISVVGLLLLLFAFWLVVWRRRKDEEESEE